MRNIQLQAVCTIRKILAKFQSCVFKTRQRLHKHNIVLFLLSWPKLVRNFRLASKWKLKINSFRRIRCKYWCCSEIIATLAEYKLFIKLQLIFSCHDAKHFCWLNSNYWKSPINAAVVRYAGIAQTIGTRSIPEP